jgi:hypothetical protein
MANHKPKIMDLMMAEPIEMPGFPQIIVSRHFAYHWLKACGWDVSERGYGSLDYTIFAKQAVDYPLTDEAERDRWLGQVRNDYLRGGLAA